jgi:hypothetical protein
MPEDNRKRVLIGLGIIAGMLAIVFLERDRRSSTRAGALKSYKRIAGQFR